MLNYDKTMINHSVPQFYNSALNNGDDDDDDDNGIEQFSAPGN
jgi:hypothetical protein